MCGRKNVESLNMTIKSTKSIDSFGDTRWANKYGMPHREDGPAVEYANNTKIWTSIGVAGIYRVNDHYVSDSDDNDEEYEKICKECGLVIACFSYYSLQDKRWKNFRYNLVPTCMEEKMLRALT